MPKQRQDDKEKEEEENNMCYKHFECRCYVIIQSEQLLEWYKACKMVGQLSFSASWVS